MALKAGYYEENGEITIDIQGILSLFSSLKQADKCTSQGFYSMLAVFRAPAHLLLAGSISEKKKTFICIIHLARLSECNAMGPVVNYVKKKKFCIV